MASDLVTLSNELAGAVERVSASVVAVHARPRIGTSGVVWRKNLVLTTSEGIRSEDDIRLVLPTGQTVEAKLRGRDPRTDLALLDADTGSIEPLSLAPDSDLKAGQLALAVGRTASTGPIASLGIVSGVSGEWKPWRGGGKLSRFVRLDVSVYPTTSGGAVVDAAGRWIGLLSTGLSRTSVLALTSSTIEAVASQLLDRGYIARGFLGIALQPVRLTDDLKQRFQLEQSSGIMLLGIEPGGPAAEAGLMLGDVLLSAGERALSDPEALAQLLDSTAIGDQLSIRIARGGTIHDLTVKIGERPGKDR